MIPEFVTKDSGKREEFDTGARRDIRVGKGRYDLLSPIAWEKVAKGFHCFDARKVSESEARHWVGYFTNSFRKFGDQNDLVRSTCWNMLLGGGMEKNYSAEALLTPFNFDAVPPMALARLAGIYERGAVKYGDNNWQKGMPFSRFLDSAMRHFEEDRMGLKDEDHLMQSCWNRWAILHLWETKPELNDIIVKPNAL